MPTYEFECASCRKRFDEVRPIANRNDPAQCKCGSIAARGIFTPPMAQPDIRPYVAVAGDRAGRHISSRKEHREYLKRNRLVEVGDAPIRPTKQMRPLTVTRADRERRRADLREALRAHVPLETLRKTR